CPRLRRPCAGARRPVAERDGPRREVHGVHTPVDELEASFVGYVNGTSRLATAPRAAFPRIATNRITAEVHRRLLGSSRRRSLRAIVVQIDDGKCDARRPPRRRPRGGGGGAV